MKLEFDNKKLLYVAVLALILFCLTFIIGGSMGAFSFLGNDSIEVANNLYLIRAFILLGIACLGMLYYIRERGKQ